MLLDCWVTCSAAAHASRSTRLSQLLRFFVARGRRPKLHALQMAEQNSCMQELAAAGGHGRRGCLGVYQVQAWGGWCHRRLASGSNGQGNVLT